MKRIIHRKLLSNFSINDYNNILCHGSYHKKKNYPMRMWYRDDVSIPKHIFVSIVSYTHTVAVYYIFTFLPLPKYRVSSLRSQFNVAINFNNLLDIILCGYLYIGSCLTAIECKYYTYFMLFSSSAKWGFVKSGGRCCEPRCVLASVF